MSIVTQFFWFSVFLWCNRERLVFSFQYSWCLRIVKGSSKQIRFLTCVTSGGGGKPDPFGMVAPVVDEPDASALSLSAFVRADEQQEEERKAPPPPLLKAQKP